MGNYFYFGIDMKCARRISISLLESDLAEKEFSKKIPKYFISTTRFSMLFSKYG